VAKVSEVKLGPIGQIALHVSDIEKSVEFYGGTLGMKKIFDTPSLAFFDNGGIRLMLSSGEGEPSGDRSVIYYRVDDIQAAFSEFSAAGVEFQDEPHVIHSAENYELWMVFFKDPDGNQLALMNEIGVHS
jgi:catechol 2,3-dioxygenase-like lactoylglutathione lyase family enzyme